MRHRYDDPMNSNVDDLDDLVRRVEAITGPATATSFLQVSEDRRFVAEALVSAAGLFLLNRYFSGFFKPIEEMGRRHGEAAVALLRGLAKGAPSQEEVDTSRSAIQEALPKAREEDTAERRAFAEEEVRRALREHGESDAVAARKAGEITEAVLGG